MFLYSSLCQVCFFVQFLIGGFRSPLYFIYLVSVCSPNSNYESSKETSHFPPNATASLYSSTTTSPTTKLTKVTTRSTATSPHVAPTVDDLDIADMGLTSGLAGLAQSGVAPPPHNGISGLPPHHASFAYAAAAAAAGSMAPPYVYAAAAVDNSPLSEYSTVKEEFSFQLCNHSFSVETGTGFIDADTSFDDGEYTEREREREREGEREK